MKKSIAAFLISVCFSTLSVWNTSNAAPVPFPGESVATLPNTTTFKIISTSTNRPYQIFVYRPQGDAPKDGFPVIYLTDANYRFATVMETAKNYARVSRNIDRRAVIVGIGYPDDVTPGQARALDLTMQPGDITVPPTFGDAENFLKFITQELRPTIQTRISINQEKQSLFGHSFGGLFVLYVLATEPSAFQTYLAASPSLWWGNRYMLNQDWEGISASLEASQEKKHILLTVGTLEQSTNQPNPPANATILPGVLDRTQVDDSIALHKKFSTLENLIATLVVFPDEDHGSVVPAAVSRAVKFSLAPANLPN